MEENIEIRAIVEFFETNGQIKAKVKFPTAEDSRFRTKHGLRGIKSTGFGEFEVTANALFEFLQTNGVKFYKDIQFENEKEYSWYEFSHGNVTKKARTLNKSFLAEWGNYDCPELRKKTTADKVLNTDGLGFNWPIFDAIIADACYKDCSFDLTDKEAKMIMNEFPESTFVGKEVRKYYSSNKFKQEEILSLKAEVEALEKSIQDVIDSHQDEIINKIKEYGENKFAFDCGFTWFYFDDDELKKMIETLYYKEIRYSTKLNISMPYVMQSIYGQALGAKMVCSLIKKELGLNIHYESVLD